MHQCFCFADKHVSCQRGLKLDPAICSRFKIARGTVSNSRRQQAQKLVIGVRADLAQEKHAEGVHSLQYLCYLAQLLTETHDCFHLIPVHHKIAFILLNILCALCMFECQGCHKLLSTFFNYRTLANAFSVSAVMQHSK